MTPLKARLVAMIEAGGPIPVPAYFAACLTDPEHGYYMARDPFGRQGDFITAPEISQLFGEMVGIWLVLAARNLPSGGPVTLAEFGPGRGTLMRDMLRVIGRLDPDLRHRLDVVLIEASPHLKSLQSETLAGLGPVRHGADASFLPEDRPLLLVGNEFFDALPIAQYVALAGRWHERVVGLRDGDLALMAGPAVLPHGAVAIPPEPDGLIIELAEARNAVMADLGARLARQSGFGLFIDYGFDRPGTGDTLQAIRANRFDDVLAHPGEADLTSHVDFPALAAAARGAGCVTGLMTQGDFLLGLGLLERAGALGADKDEGTREAITSAVERLAAPDAMGTLFKVLAVGAPGAALPQPFSGA